MLRGGETVECGGARHGPDLLRRFPRQAEVLTTVVRAADRLGVAAYEHFALRDADSANPDPFFRFGLMTSDYRPKPAFETYRSLIAELGHRPQ